jgi:glutamate formiminotransferase/formiminotetrahydrofolate cyclodeaminase
MASLIECVPNFSEGRDRSVIERITAEVERTEGVKLLDVDPGRATHRTVVTFAGEPEAVVEAAVRAARRAAELIDMRRHRGEHPRFGALDVCPLVPVSGISMEETVEHARELARRLGEEAGLTVYCYEEAAFDDGRRNLATVRAGEYEGLEERLADPHWQPDFGPAEFNPRSGATAVGARKFLIAYNVNLNTTSTRRANAVAFDVRERGRIQRRGNPLTGEIVRDDQGDPVYIPGALESVKAIGWYIEEYGICQVSMNLTDLEVTPLHRAFEEARRKAAERGLRVTGSEIVGLVPLQVMMDAGRYFLARQQRSLGASDEEVLRIAIKSLGLDDLKPFEPEKKIIEHALGQAAPGRLASLPLDDFIERVASEAPAPGGGSVAAAVGSLGAALATMVANLASHKRGWDERWQEFSEQAAAGKALYQALRRLVDEDSRAFDGILSAFRLSSKTDEERAKRRSAIEEATRRAIEVPLEVMARASEVLPLARAMAETGTVEAVSDAGVGALCARAAVIAARLNVEINGAQLEDREEAAGYLSRAEELEKQARAMEDEVLALVRRRIAEDG